MSRRNTDLPRIAERAVRIFLPEASRESALGDLTEEYAEVLGRRSVPVAAVWLVCETMSLLSGYWRARLGGARNRLPPKSTPRSNDRSPPRDLGWRSNRKKGIGTSLVVDVRLAVRGLARSPGFTATVVVTLALGIGLNTSIFSLINAVLINPMPYASADRFVLIDFYSPGLGYYFATTRASERLPDWRDRARTIERFEAYEPEELVWLSSSEPANITGVYVTPGLFTALGVAPFLGRRFQPDEGAPDSDPVVILSEAFWRQALGGVGDVVGTNINLEDTSHTVVGVMPEVYGFPSADLWVAHTFDYQPERVDSGQIVAWLAPGVTLAQAQAEMRGLSIERQERGAGRDDQYARLSRPGERTANRARLQLLFLQALVTLVLLIACANVFNLMLAHNSRRRQQIAVRAALGAGRSRLVRESLVESALLALSGGILGLLVARWSTSVLRALAPESLPSWWLGRIDATVLAWTLGVSLLAALLCGTWPALWSSRPDLVGALKESGPQVGAPRRQRLLRDGLVLGQVALCMTLLTAAGLLAHSLVRLYSVDPGFDADRVVAMEFSLRETRRDWEDTDRSAFFERLLERVESLAAVESASLIDHAPPFQGIPNPVWIESRRQEVWSTAVNARVGPGFFRTVGIPMLRTGSAPETNDVDDRAVVVNEGFVRRAWPEESPLGQRFRIGSPDLGGPWYRIVGVAADISLVARNLAVADLQIYRVMGGSDVEWAGAVLARTSADPSTLIQPLKEQVWTLDRSLPVERVTTVASRLASADYFETTQTVAGLLGLFSGLGLALSAVGIGGVVACLVSERTKEIGVRRVLGAPARSVQSMVIRQGMVPVLLGIAVGLGGGIGIGKLLQGLLFEVGPTDPGTLLATTVLVVIVTLLATWLPARRATLIDPLATLRAD